MKPNQTKILYLPVLLLYAIVMIEGGSVMAIELLGVKMMAPFYGTTLYVWAGVLTVTLAGLASGYFLGGRIAAKWKSGLTAPLILFIGAILVFLMPYSAIWIIQATDQLGIRLGSLLAAMVFLMPPLICMGMISPIVIQLATHSIENTGKVAGMIYALSTLAGIVMTLTTGIYLLPEWGIKHTVVLVASMLAGVALLSFLLIRNYKLFSGSLLLVLALMLSTRSEKKISSGVVWLKDRSVGILGQITILDYLDSDKHVMRYMLINGIPQTYLMTSQMPYSSWPYIHRLATMSSTKPKDSKALLIGMAGGTLAMELKTMGFQTDIVEIDPRMPELAEKYFGFNPQGFQIFIDDGRHFLNTSQSKYDLVIIDVVNGEVQPFHMFTKEAFAQLKQRCTEDGLVIVNFQGYLNGHKSLPLKSVMKTMAAAGFKLKLYSHLGTKDEEGDPQGDLHIIAYLGNQNFTQMDVNRLNLCCKTIGYTFEELFTDVPIQIEEGLLLEDDLPNLEKLNLASVELWRRRKQKDFQQFSQLGFTLFN